MKALRPGRTILNLEVPISLKKSLMAEAEEAGVTLSELVRLKVSYLRIGSLTVEMKEVKGGIEALKRKGLKVHK